MTPELEERASILVHWIVNRPELLIDTELLRKGILLELQAAYRWGMRQRENSTPE